MNNQVDHRVDPELYITNANYSGNYTILVTFNDGMQKLVDFKPFLEASNHPDIKKYLNEKSFKAFALVQGNLDWNDYDMCFSIEDLYFNSILKKKHATEPI